MSETRDIPGPSKRKASEENLSDACCQFSLFKKLRPDDDPTPPGGAPRQNRGGPKPRFSYLLIAPEEGHNVPRTLNEENADPSLPYLSLDDNFEACVILDCPRFIDVSTVFKVFDVHNKPYNMQLLPTATEPLNFIVNHEWSIFVLDHNLVAGDQISFDKNLNTTISDEFYYTLRFYKKPSEAESSKKPGDDVESDIKPGDGAESIKKSGDDVESDIKPGDCAESSINPGDGAESSINPGDGADSSKKPGDDDTESSKKPSGDAESSKKPDDDSESSKKPDDDTESSKKPGDDTESSKTPGDDTESSKTPGDDTESSKTPSDDAESSRKTVDVTESSKTQPSDDTESSKTPIDNAESSEKPVDDTESSKTPSDDAESSKTPGDDTESSKTPSDDAESSKKPGDDTESSAKPSDDTESSKTQPSDDTESSKTQPSDDTESSKTPSDNAESSEKPSDDTESSKKPSDDAESSEKSGHDAESTSSAAGIEMPAFKVIYHRILLESTPPDQEQINAPRPGSRPFLLDAICLSKTLTAADLGYRLYFDVYDAIVLADNPRIAGISPGDISIEFMVYDRDNRRYILKLLHHVHQDGIIGFCLDGWDRVVRNHNFRQGDLVAFYKFLDRRISNGYYYVAMKLPANVDHRNRIKPVKPGSRPLNSEWHCFSKILLQNEVCTGNAGLRLEAFQASYFESNRRSLNELFVVFDKYDVRFDMKLSYFFTRGRGLICFLDAGWQPFVETYNLKAGDTVHVHRIFDQSVCNNHYFVITYTRS